MARDAMSREEAAASVLEGLQAMILLTARRAAGEQYAPSPDPDGSDDQIKWRKREMEELRRLRTRFEEIATGVLVDEPVWEVSVLFKDRAMAAEFSAKLLNGEAKELCERPAPFVTMRAR